MCAYMEAEEVISPGHAIPRQAVGGHASTMLVKSPSDALIAVAPSSHGTAALHAKTGLTI